MDLPSTPVGMTDRHKPLGQKVGIKREFPCSKISSKQENKKG